MTFRPIDIGDRPKLSVRPGAVPSLDFLPIDKLLIDGDYQRPLGLKNWIAIQKIAAAFNWSHFTPIVAAPTEDGYYSVIDGQHRTHAAALIGADRVPAMIVSLSEAQQAAAFSAINGQVTAISVFHIYRAALVAMEPWALACCEVVAQGGAELMTYHPSAATKKSREIYCIALIRRHVEAGRGAMVSAGLRAVGACKSADRLGVWQNGFLSPWFSALQSTPRAVTRDLGAFLQIYDPVAIESDVRRLNQTPTYAGLSHTALMQRIMVGLLNKWMAAEVAA